MIFQNKGINHPKKSEGYLTCITEKFQNIPVQYSPDASQSLGHDKMVNPILGRDIIKGRKLSLENQKKNF